MQTSYNGVPLPKDGEAIQFADGKFHVPDHPIIPFIEGDGTGRDIWRASQKYSMPRLERPTAENVL
jgi:isocitrate dehydrogenase